MNVYLHIQGEQRGPYAKAQVQTMWNSGLITSDALYWQEGMSEWAPISALVTEPTAPPPMPQAPQKVLPPKAHYNPASGTFTGTMPQMVKLAMHAIQDLGWKLDNANETLGMVTFETGMSWGSFSGVACSLTIEETGENEFRVSGTGKQNVRGGQLVALDLFGEARGKATKAISRMKELAR